MSFSGYLMKFGIVSKEVASIDSSDCSSYRVRPPGRGLKRVLFVLFATIMCIPVLAWSQIPYPPQAPVPEYGANSAPSPGRRQLQQPTQEYAFRPELTNPEYGECLQLEKHWKELSNSYAHYYQQARMMHPGNPQYPQMTNFLQQMKMQLDAAWNNFSSRCIYFPRR